MQLEYENPPEQLNLRPYLTPGSLEYQLMIKKLHDECSISVILNYCGTCHSIETKDTIGVHNNHATYSKANIHGCFLVIIELIIS